MENHPLMWKKKKSLNKEEAWQRRANKARDYSTNPMGAGKKGTEGEVGRNLKQLIGHEKRVAG